LNNNIKTRRKEEDRRKNVDFAGGWCLEPGVIPNGIREYTSGKWQVASSRKSNSKVFPRVNFVDFLTRMIP
jgi:hypothetical protein